MSGGPPQEDLHKFIRMSEEERIQAIEKALQAGTDEGRRLAARLVASTESQEERRERLGIPQLSPQ